MATATIQASLIKKAFEHKSHLIWNIKKKVEKNKISNAISNSGFNWIIETIPGRNSDEYITNYHRCGS